MTRKALSITVVLSLFAALAIVGTGAPGAGRLPWGDYQELLRYQVMAPGVQVPEREYLLLAAEPLTPEATEELARLGITLDAAVGAVVAVRGPITAFAGLGPDGEALPWVQMVLPAIPLGTSQQPTFYGLRQSDLRGAIKLDSLPVTGKGITVGVLDNGFTGDLGRELGATRVQYLRLEWVNGQARVVKGFTTNKHGEACARGVLAVAPDVDLVLLSASTLQDRLKLLDLIARGEIKVHVLTDSTYFPVPLDHNDGRGALAQAGDRVVSQGVFYTYAIGNLALGDRTDRSFYRGLFQDADRNSSHDFTPGAPAGQPDRNTLAVTVAPWVGTAPVTLTICLAWNGWPHHVQKDPGVWRCDDHIRIQDIDLFLYYLDGTRVIPVGRSVNNQLGPCYPEFVARHPGVKHVPPLEVIQVRLDRPGTYLIDVQNVTLSDHKLPGLFERRVEFHLYVYISGTRLNMEHHTVAGSIINMGGAQNVTAVGAVGWTGTSWTVMPYSSRGPTSDGRLKPELVAPTGYESPVYKPFFGGTSASAPLVAGAAALLLQADKTLSPARLREFLTCGASSLCGGANGPCISGSPTVSPCCGHRWNHTVGCGLLNILESHRMLKP